MFAQLNDCGLMKPYGIKDLNQCEHDQVVCLPDGTKWSEPILTDPLIHMNIIPCENKFRNSDISIPEKVLKYLVSILFRSQSGYD